MPAMHALHHKIRKLAAVNIPGVAHRRERHRQRDHSRSDCIVTLVSRRGRLSRSIAQLCRRALSKASCSATKKAHSRAPQFPNGDESEAAESGTLFLDEIAELDARDPGQAAAPVAGWAFHPPWRSRGTEIAHAVHFCHQPQPAARDCEPAISVKICFIAWMASRLQIPPLRERAEDISALTNYFLAKYSERYHCRPAAFSSSGMERLQSYWWPGNIRQLENVVRRYVLLGSEKCRACRSE